MGKQIKIDNRWHSCSNKIQTDQYTYVGLGNVSFSRGIRRSQLFGGENGWNDRGMDFKFFVEGTDAQHTKELFVQFLPTNVSITGFQEPNKVSKQGTLNPEWEIDGVNMYYDQAVFVPSSGCSSQVAPTTILPSNGIKDHVTLGIPLSLLSACFYTIYLKDPCGHQHMVGNIEVVP